MEDSLGSDMIRIPDEWLSQTDNLYDFIDECYGDIQTKYLDPNYWANQAILTPLNDDVDAINT